MDPSAVNTGCASPPRSLAGAGVAEVGAVITDGNFPSERLFQRLGFIRLGEWRR